MPRLFCTVRPKFLLAELPHRQRVMVQRAAFVSSSIEKKLVQTGFLDAELELES
jgi:hypothetical protein